ncbi:hypothetical protein LUZ63_004986 [Rhynchospora breviuscula]|uniref:PHD finger protein ALFIN-LIKE n=1 Tax=Rhynchospora breviuscula TaxID=2022672 RepID=A0A9Q0CM09_9POAL|nr:hypothetical protein LUZ63_004986 [Rhynchospora breviuscula]
MNANGGSPEEVFKDFRARRTGILKALTIDVDKFFQECDPEKDNLCLYGFSDENWQVDLPAEEVPPELPEPVLGINFARDGMKQKDWLALVAVHSDSWLLAVSFYFGARFGFDKESRDRLFSMINSLPTIYEVVTGAATDNKKQHKEKTSNGSSKANNKSAPKAGNTTRGSQVPPPTHEEEEDEEDIDRGEGGEEEGEEGEEGEEEGQGGATLCGACGDSYGTNEFWICCDVCENWFHGKCVRITPARAEHIKHYKCPACSNNKRGRA